MKFVLRGKLAVAVFCLVLAGCESPLSAAGGARR